MKRVTVVEYGDAAPGVRQVYDEIMETAGTPTVPNVFKAVGNNENVLRAVWSMFKHTHGTGEIPALLKELILFRISVNAGNKYCEALHGHAACTLDPTLTYDDLVALSEGESLSKLPASYQVAIEVVSQIALQPKSVADDTFDYEERLRDEGFSEAEIDELVAEGYFGVMMNLLTDAYDVPREAPFPPEDA